MPTANKAIPVRPGHRPVCNPELIANCPEVPWSSVNNCRVMEITIVKSPAIQAISPIVDVFGTFTDELVVVRSLVAVLTEATEAPLDICYYEVFVRR